MINTVVTGGNGQLGSELKVHDSDNINFEFIDKEDLDLTNSRDVKHYFQDKKIDYIVNCAAYTAVDKAEEEVESATILNERIPQHLAEICRKKKACLIHISTDYVFAGDGYLPLSEESFAQPISVYGSTKLNGERKIQEILPYHFIFRTSWLYSTYGKNFVKTILRASAEKEELGIIADQFGTPTYAKDLAIVIIEIMKSKSTNYGLYHYSNEGIASWYDFAEYFVMKKGIECRITPLRTHQYPTKAIRPPFYINGQIKI